MSKKTYSPYGTDEPGAETLMTERGEGVPRRDREVAKYYSDEMSKEAVGSLFKNYRGEELEMTEKKAAELFGTDPFEKFGDDQDFIDYINSFSTGRRPSSPAVTQPEREAPAASPGRKSSLSLSSRGGGETNAEIIYEQSGSDAAESKKSEYAGSVFKRVVMENAKAVLAVSGLVVLLVFSVLVYNINSLNYKLSVVEGEIAKAKYIESEYTALQIENNGLIEQLREAQRLNDELLAQVFQPVEVEPDQVPAASPAEPALPLPSPAETPPPVATPPANTPAPPASPASSEYRVQEGDTFWGIAAAHLGSGARYPEILAANNMREGDTLKVGAIIKIPKQ